MEDTPMMNRTNTMTKVVRDVLMLRVKVWVILVFTISTVDAFGPMSLMFSRIRSKITIVALMEYPTIVSRQAIAVEPTDHLSTYCTGDALCSDL